MSPSPNGLALVPGRFRLLLLALFLAFGGTAVVSGTRAERLVDAILLALVLVAAVLDLRERGRRWRLGSSPISAAIARRRRSTWSERSGNCGTWAMRMGRRSRSISRRTA